MTHFLHAAWHVVVFLITVSSLAFAVLGLIAPAIFGGRDAGPKLPNPIVALAIGCAALALLALDWVLH